jgi:hypothetical protein
MKRFMTLSIVLLLYGTSVPALTPQNVPEPLKPWINWVLEDESQYQCPFFYQDFQDKHCSWPGTLSLALQTGGGRFDMAWTVYRQDWVFLPGDSEHWPQQVNIDKQAVAVIEKDGKPAIQLPPGYYRIGGEFFWDKLPESLAIPDSVGLIRLDIDHKNIAYPSLKQGAVWFNAASEQPDDGQNRLDIQVFRQIVDDIPLQAITRLELEVSGAAREISLPHALLPDFIPVALNSPLPARIEADGRLSVQVRPGRWSIEIHARHPQPLSQLDFAVADADWPQAEVWVFQAMPALRLVEIEKLTSIDGSQTNLPGEWRHLPAYQLKQGDSMLFKTIRRGDPEPEPNQLTLTRKLWLDFDGGGYTVSDQIAGTMTRDWRLDVLPATLLGQVQLNGQNQLITQLADKRQGVEVRRGAIALNADSRIAGSIGTLDATGWLQRFRQVRAELNIPPGWRVLAVGGVDNVPDSWLTRWSLLDLFMVLVVALAVGRLWNWQWGLFALFSLVLIWQEADAPQLVWLNILAALALIEVLPANRFLRWVKWYRNACWLALLLIVVPFMIAQIRIGIYPQLEQPRQPIAGPQYPASADAGNAQLMEMEAAPAPAIAEKSEEGRMIKKSRAYSSAPAPLAKPTVNFDRIDPEANLQTGPGLPQWQWQRLHLSWNGAVDSGQQIRLWYLPPAATLLLHFLQALLAAALSLRMLGMLNNRWKFSIPTLSCLLALMFLANPAQDVYAADFPDQAMLDQLKNRLLQAPQCLPACAQIAAMNITADPAEMHIELQIHAQQDVAVPLPAQFEQWMPEQLSVDGKEDAALIRQDDGSLWLALSKGVHKVMLSGRHAPHDRFSLPLPLPPQRTLLKTEGWRVEGLYENGRVGPQLEFSRLDTGKTSVLQQSSLPAFVRIERTLHLGLDWRMTTRVERLAAGDGAIVLELPLLSGEAVTSQEVRVKNGKVLVNMAAGQTELEWQSLMEKTERLELKAADTRQWSEVWRADVSPIWHLQTSGIAVVHHQDAQGVWLPEWRPWPGETVQLNISRPQAVAGATLTIDKSELQIKPGKRSEDAELKLSIRSSKGGLHNVMLPVQAVLQGVTIDGVSQPIRQKAETVTLPIRPGTQQIALNWQSPMGQRNLLTTPKVNLGADSVNSHIQAIIGEDRWVLLTFGPKFGPAALIWGLLIVLALLAAGLGRIRLTPLKHWQWFLLLIGLSQIHIGAAVCVVGWLLAVGWRARQAPERTWVFNLTQVGLAILTLTSLALLFGAVQQGLLGSPDMQITGNQSTAFDLNWYQDRSSAELPEAVVVSVPLTVYRLLMLAWSLWMAVALLNWLRWGWGCFSSNGVWRSRVIKPQA